MTTPEVTRLNEAVDRAIAVYQDEYRAWLDGGFQSYHEKRMCEARAARDAAEKARREAFGWD